MTAPICGAINGSNQVSKIKSFLHYINSSIIDQYGYHAGLIAFFLSLAVLLFAQVFSLRPQILVIFVLQAVGVLTLGGVAMIKTGRALLKNRKSRLLKWGVGIANTLIVGTLSLIWSKEIINSITGTDPSNFTISMKVFPILLSPAAWIMLVGIAAFVYAVAFIMKLNALAVAGTFTGGRIEVPPLLPSLGRIFGAASIFFIAVVSGWWPRYIGD